MCGESDTCEWHVYFCIWHNGFINRYVTYIQHRIQYLANAYTYGRLWI